MPARRPTRTSTQAAASPQQKSSCVVSLLTSPFRIAAAVVKGIIRITTIFVVAIQPHLPPTLQRLPTALLVTATLCLACSLCTGLSMVNAAVNGPAYATATAQASQAIATRQALGQQVTATTAAQQAIRTATETAHQAQAAATAQAIVDVSATAQTVANTAATATQQALVQQTATSEAIAAQARQQTAVAAAPHKTATAQAANKVATTQAAATAQTARKVPTPQAPQARKPAPTTKPNTSNLRYNPFGPDRDCKDFRTQAEAQVFFEAAGGPAQDPHQLDKDHDGIACEDLP